MPVRSWLGVTAVAAMLLGLPASPALAATAAPTTAGTATSPPVVPYSPSIAGLYALSADGETGWIVVHHDRAANRVRVILHLSGHARREYLRASYRPQEHRLHVTRYADGYRHEYTLWLSHRPGGEPSFGGYGDRYDLSESDGVTVHGSYRYGVHMDYISDDSVM